MRAAEGTKPRRSSAGASKNVIKLEVNHMANASTAQELRQETRPMLMVDNPESAFIYNPRIDPRSMDDIMTCILARSEAIVTLLLGDINDDGDPTHGRATTENALWLLQGQLEQMRMVMRNYRTEGVA